MNSAKRFKFVWGQSLRTTDLWYVNDTAGAGDTVTKFMEVARMINSGLQSSTQDFKKMRDSFVTTTVDMTPSKLLDEVAKGIKTECDRLAPYAEYKPVSCLEVEDIHKYLSTLIWMRCQKVSSEFNKSFLPYKRLYNNVVVPTFVYQLAISIGEATDSDYAIRFVPAYSIDSKELLSVDQMSEISDVFLSLAPVGFSHVIGMPKETSGELDFMACCHVDEVVRSYKDSHPVYGFMAAFFAQKELNEITGLMCRVIYGYDSDYKITIRRIMSSLSAKQPLSAE